MTWTPTQIKTMLDGLGVSVAYHHFRQPDDPTPAPLPPFCVYFFEGDTDLEADNINYQKIRAVCIELYSDEKAFDLETRLEEILTANRLAYSVDYTYIESEKLYMTIYRTSVLM